MKPGQYRVEIKASGLWSLNIRQLVYTTGQSTPHVFSGSGDGISTVLDLKAGTIPVTLTHFGNSNFIVYVMNASGQDNELLVNEIGNYSGSVALRVQSGGILNLPPGLHIIAVQADGSWTISLG